MKRFIVCAALSGIVVAAPAAQTPKYGVKVTAEKNVDFSKFKTYSWTQGQPSAIKEIDAQIMTAVDQQLAMLGMTKATSGPGDVLAAYYSLTRTDVDLKAKPDASGQRPQYAVGTLMVALLDPANRRRLLQLRTDKPLDAKSDQLEPTISAAVAEMFTQYPTRRPK
jgi:Domain of unknown function (DUF4136)